MRNVQGLIGAWRATLKPGIWNPESQYNTESKNYPKHSLGLIRPKVSFYECLG